MDSQADNQQHDEPHVVSDNAGLAHQNSDGSVEIEIDHGEHELDKPAPQQPPLNHSVNQVSQSDSSDAEITIPHGSANTLNSQSVQVPPQQQTTSPQPTSTGTTPDLTTTNQSGQLAPQTPPSPVHSQATLSAPIMPPQPNSAAGAQTRQYSQPAPSPPNGQSQSISLPPKPTVGTPPKPTPPPPPGSRKVEEEPPQNIPNFRRAGSTLPGVPSRRMSVGSPPQPPTQQNPSQPSQLFESQAPPPIAQTRRAKAKSKLPFLKKILIIGGIVSVILIGIVIAVQMLGGSSAPVTPTYQELIGYRHTDSSKGTRFTFAHPAQAELVSTSPDKVLFEHYVPEEKQGSVGLTQYATLQVSRLKTGKLTNNGQRQLLDTVLGNARDGELQGGSTTGLVSNLEVGSFKKQGNKGNKYIAKVSYTVTPDGAQEGEFQEFSGTMIVAFGTQHTYFFIAQSEKNVWEQNADIWDQVISSFRFDV